MLVLLSPSKTFDLDSPFPKSVEFGQPSFLNQSEKLIESLKKLNVVEIEKLMKISPKLATLNLKRFQDWFLPFSPENSRPALFTFMGDVYEGLNVSSFNHQDLKFAEKSIGILSGLYGFLKPFDLMQPYRLEMGIPLRNIKGKSLYHFWGDQVANLLHKNYPQTWINLASNEYFKVLEQAGIQNKVIQPIFKDEKKGKYKVISFYSKRARGMMARYIILNRIKNPEDLKDFKEQGYTFNSKNSTQEKFVFTREEQK